jgi:hypothetical protein
MLRNEELGGVFGLNIRHWAAAAWLTAGPRRQHPGAFGPRRIVEDASIFDIKLSGLVCLWELGPIRKRILAGVVRYK